MKKTFNLESKQAGSDTTQANNKDLGGRLVGTSKQYDFTYEQWMYISQCTLFCSICSSPTTTILFFSPCMLSTWEGDENSHFNYKYAIAL